MTPEEDVRETWGGWARTGCAAVAIVATPIGVVLTLSILSSAGAEGVPVGVLDLFIAMGVAGVLALSLIAALAPFAVAAVWVGRHVARRRAMAFLEAAEVDVGAATVAVDHSAEKTRPSETFPTPQ